VATATPEGKQPKALPPPNSDFYELAETLGAEEHALLKQLRTFLDAKVAPIITRYWAEDAFPFELLPAFKELGVGGLGMQGYECRGGSALLVGLAAMQLARVDSSIATFFGVHNGLAMGSIYEAGSEEQKQKWLPPMARFEKIGCFGLTEPMARRSGSATRRGAMSRSSGLAMWPTIRSRASSSRTRRRRDSASRRSRTRLR
jgi:glutaryl-CoA dehydrogenase